MLLQPGRGDEAEGDGFHYHIGGVGSPEFPHDVAAVDSTVFTVMNIASAISLEFMPLAKNCRTSSSFGDRTDSLVSALNPGLAPPMTSRTVRTRAEESIDLNTTPSTLHWRSWRMVHISSCTVLTMILWPGLPV